jgi:hypothetical protein
MREYVAVPPSLLPDKKGLVSWILRSLDYGSSLKPKSAGKKPKKVPSKPKPPASAKKKK